MKKTLLLLPFLLAGCSQRTYSFKELTGFKVSDITQIQVSYSVYQSLAWNIDQRYYFYLNCDYVLVDFNIEEEFFCDWPLTEDKDDAICITVSSNNQPHNLWYSGLFYISHKTHYMYAYAPTDKKSFRSKYPMPNSFLMGLAA